MDKQFIAKLSEDTNRAIQSIKASGHVYNGNPPWGYRIVGEKYSHTIEPMPIAREYVPQIFQRYLDGQSLRQIAAWLDSEGVPTRKGGKWNEGTVRWILTTRAYAGQWVSRDTGQTICGCEALITPSTFDRTQDALKNHPRSGPRGMNPPMLAKLRCIRCGSPMYRIKAGKKQIEHYRCTGSGAQRKGCGNMVPLWQTDIIITVRIFTTSTEPYKTRHWIEGTYYDDEISNVKQDIHEAVEAERFEDMPALQAKLVDLREKQTTATKGHYEWTDMGITVGQHFGHELDAAGKREYLKTRDIRVLKVGKDAMQVMIDGIDHGVFIYPPDVLVYHPKV
jgi:hypothetical protein